MGNQKTETFVSRNIRTITFIICIAVFLAFFLPIALLKADTLFNPDRDTRPKMNLEDVIRLSDRKGNIKGSDISKFVCETTDTESGIYYYVNIEPHYTLIAVEDEKTGMLFYCQLSDMETKEDIDVLKDDVRAFLTKD